MAYNKDPAEAEREGQEEREIRLSLVLLDLKDDEL